MAQLTWKAKSAICQAKLWFKQKVEDEFRRINAKAAFQHLGTMMDDGDSSRSDQLPASTDPVTFATNLNNFFNRFDNADFSVECLHLMTVAPVVEGSVIISVDEVRTQFQKTKATKAAGPDGISARLLNSCADSIAPAFQPLFQASVPSTLVLFPLCGNPQLSSPSPKSPDPLNLTIIALLPSPPYP